MYFLNSNPLDFPFPKKPLDSLNKCKRNVYLERHYLSFFSFLLQPLHFSSNKRNFFNPTILNSNFYFISIPNKKRTYRWLL